MFARTAAFVFVAFTALAAATPANVARGGGGDHPVTTTVTVTAPATTSTIPASQCNTGSLQCCNSVQPASSSAASSLLGLLGIVVDNLDVLVGITCSPLSVIGVGGSSCTADPVCCQNDSFNGLIAIGCTPINVNL